MNPEKMIRNLFLFMICTVASCTDQGGWKKSHQPKQISSEAESMQRILALDDSLGKIRNHASEKISLSETIKQYTSEINKMDFNGCPGDFTFAFKRHRDAWSKIMAITGKYPGLRGEMHALFDSIKAGKDSAEFNLRLAAIWSTWSEVENAVKK